MKIGQLIKELRLQRGYSQLYLSNKTGLSERTIQRLENNHVNPSSNTLRLLGNVFDEDFFKYKNQEIIINKYKKINIMYVYWNLTIKFIIKILNLLLKK
jgi:transcriptional regulator with XRE-family HTH domain